MVVPYRRDDAEGRYCASTAARNNDPEIMWEGYPPSSFDAEQAVSIVASVFEHVEPQYWDGRFFSLAHATKSGPRTAAITTSLRTCRDGETAAVAHEAGRPRARKEVLIPPFQDGAELR